jgi:hypothetical protein
VALPLDARARAAQRVLELVGRCGGSGVVLVGVKWRWSQLPASQGSRIALVAAGLAALGACGASTQDDPADTARDAPWTLLGVSKGGRSLRVAYDQSGCWRGGRAALTVRESANGVELDLRQTREPSDSCTDSIATGLLSVALKDPIGGRLVSGGPRLRRARGCSPASGARTPRAIRGWWCPAWSGWRPRTRRVPCASRSSAPASLRGRPVACPLRRRGRAGRSHGRGRASPRRSA